MKRTSLPATSAYRIRLIIGFTLVIGLLAGAWAWSLYAPLSAAVMDQQRERLIDLAHAGTVVLSSDGLQLESRLSGMVGDSSVRITVVAADGTVLADTEENPERLENHSDRPEVRAALAGRTGTDIRTSDTQGVKRMYVAMPATYAGEPVALRVSESLRDIEGLSAEARRSGVLLLPVVLVLAAGAVWRITRAAAGPVERLAEAARAMADGDLASPVPDDYGALLPLSDALVELREQLRTRLTDLEAEQRTLRVALDGLSDAVLLLEGKTVSLANRALGTMFRMPPGDLPGRELADLGLPAPIESAIAIRRDSSTPSTVELGPDPFQRYHRVLIAPLGEGDLGPRRLVVVSDVTERMRLDAVRRDFVANASHELKTPVAAIGLLAESADSAARDGDDGQALTFLSQVGDEAARLRNLVADLLDLSRIESVPDSDEIADVRRAIDLALAGHRRAAAAKGLALEADLGEVAGEDVAVLCGAADLAIALDNVLANAITYTETGRVTVRVQADDATVEIAVRDTGIGIPTSDVERVFERFYRVDRARSRTSGGTGLGLALVRNIAERSGGTASMSSEPGAGTTATLRLRRAV
jgi:two-component system phosphate regulon sensor histidine kinase PhoR